MRKLTTIVSIVTISVLLCWTVAFAIPTLPYPFWKLKFENYEVVVPGDLRENEADGVEDNWGILKVTNIIDRMTSTGTWADLATERYEITGMFYNIDVDDVYALGGGKFQVNITDRLLVPQFDLYIQDKWDTATYTPFVPCLGPDGRIDVDEYTGVTDGQLLVSMLFKPGILVESDPDAVDTVITNVIDSLTIPFSGDGLGYMDVVDGSGPWADIIIRDVFELWAGVDDLDTIYRDVYMEFDVRDHPDVGMPDCGWTVNSDDPAIGAAIPEPATMLLLGSGFLGLAGFARRRKKK